MTDRVVLQRTFAVPVSRLWRALTTGALLAEWLMPNNFQPVEGHRFQFRAEPMPHWDGVVQAEVVEITPESRLVIGLTTGDLRTTLRFTLTPRDGGVALHLEQSGFGPDQTRNRAGAAYGWRRNLDRLDGLLSKGDLP